MKINIDSLKTAIEQAVCTAHNNGRINYHLPLLVDFNGNISVYDTWIDDFHEISSSDRSIKELPRPMRVKNWTLSDFPFYSFEDAVEEICEILLDDFLTYQDYNKKIIFYEKDSVFS